MPRKPPPTASPTRKRRTAEEARTAILDAAERLLVASGPDGIRLQEVAADVGVSHPTVLHHFGSREGLVEAVVERALDSLHVGLLDAVRVAPKGPDQVAALLDGVFETLAGGGHARAFLWLALSGYAPTLEQLHVRELAAAVHDVRCALWTQRSEDSASRQAEQGKQGKQDEAPGRRPRKDRVPTFEDTYFTVLLPALALLAMSVTARKGAKGVREDEARRFRAWLARLIHQHLEAGWED